MSRLIRYWANEKTRLCRMTTGPISDAEQIRDGFVEVPSEKEFEEFREVTAVALRAGWSKAPRSFKKYLEIGRKRESSAVDDAKSAIAKHLGEAL